MNFDNMTTIVSTSQNRANYSNFKAALKSMGKENPLITRTALRVEVPLVAGQQFYEIDLLKSTGAGDRKLEKKLQKDYKFLVTHIAVGLQRQVPGSEANTPILTHPDANVFTGSNEASSLEAVYHGSLQFKSNIGVRSGEILTNFMRFAPNKSHQSAPASAQQIEHAQYGPSMEERGYFELIQNLMLDGAEENKLNFSLGAGSTAGITANTIAVIHLAGFSYSGEEIGNSLSCNL